MSRRVLLTTVAVLVVVTAAAWRLRSSDPARPDTPVVARVNGEDITARDVDVRLQELIPLTTFHANLSPEALTSLRRTALDELVLDELIIQDARRAGLVPDPTEVDREVARAQERFGSRDEFLSTLRAGGLTEDEYRGHLERRILVTTAGDAHIPPDPSEADLRDYYEANTGKFVRPEQIRLSEMLVAVDPTASDDEIAEARRQAEALAGRVRDGEPFGPLAREHSGDDWWVKNGDLGWVHRGRLDPDVEEAAFSTRVGAVGVVRSLAGFHVFRVEGRQPPAQLEFEEARASIFDGLRKQRREASHRDWIGGLRAVASIEILDPVLRDAQPFEVNQSGQAPMRPAAAAEKAGGASF